MTKSRNNYSLDTSTIELLRRTGNASEYINRIVQDHWQDWQSGLSLLRRLGWTDDDLVGACDALNGHYWSFDAPAESIALSLGDYNDHPVYPINAELVETLDGLAAFALRCVVREFWSGNRACAAAIRPSLATAEGGDQGAVYVSRGGLR